MAAETCVRCAVMRAPRSLWNKKVGGASENDNCVFHWRMLTVATGEIVEGQDRRRRSRPTWKNMSGNETGGAVRGTVCCSILMVVQQTSTAAIGKVPSTAAASAVASSSKQQQAAASSSKQQQAAASSIRNFNRPTATALASASSSSKPLAPLSSLCVWP